MSAPERIDLERPDTFGDRYRPMRRIGAGGMGTVWEAHDDVLGRSVALKMLSPALCEDEAAGARFRREAQAAGRLAHPNIAQVFDYGEDDGRPYIVLELVPGSTLRSVIDARGELPPDEAAAIGAQIADALAAAHAEGIVHRDVKPGNVMVADDGRVKVMDFGIADAVWFEPVTDSGTFLATAKYLSPEQATGGSATPASDVYALGVVLFEMVAGRPPFDGDSPFAIAFAHAHEPPPSLSELAPDVPSDLRRVVERAMSRDAKERPAAAEMAAMLRDPPGVDRTRVLQTAPVGAVPSPDAAAPTARPSRTVAVALAALLAVAVVSALVFALFMTPTDRGAPVPRHRRAVATSPVATSPSPPPGHDHRGGDEHGHGPEGKAVGHDKGD
jgi:serine/threonine protein kinase